MGSRSGKAIFCNQLGSQSSKILDLSKITQYFANDHFIPLANFETAVLKNGLYDLVLDSTVGKSTIEIYGYYKSFSILMLEIFIFVNLDHDSAASSKKCQYFLDRKFSVRMLIENFGTSSRITHQTCGHTKISM